MNELIYRYDEDWDRKKYGKVPIPRQLIFKSGNKYKNTTWVEMADKSNSDREYFYHELVPFISNLVDYLGIRLRHNQFPSNSAVGMYMSIKIIPFLVEWLMDFEVGWAWSTWGGKEYEE